MKKLIIISTLIAASTAVSTQPMAAASKQENIGVASGAIVGAAAAGPIGFILGAAAGALLGKEVEKSAKVETIEQALKNSEQSQQELQAALEEARSQLDNYASNGGFENDKNTDGQSTLQEINAFSDQGLSLSLMFTSNSSALSDKDHDTLTRIANLMLRFPHLELQLDGFADPRGSRQHNQLLSEQRVNAVRQALASHNIELSRLSGVGHGEVELDLEIADPDAFAMARKVSINFVQASSQLAQH